MRERKACYANYDYLYTTLSTLELIISKITFFPERTMCEIDSNQGKKKNPEVTASTIKRENIENRKKGKICIKESI